MEVPPIIDHPYRWRLILLLALVLATTQVILVHEYTEANYLPAIIDGIVTVGWLIVLFYLSWFVVGFVSLLQTEVITVVVGILGWLGGCFMICDMMERVFEIAYIPFVSTLPFRLLFGVPAWFAILLWYRLNVVKTEISTREQSVEETICSSKDQSAEVQGEITDRITVKDGSRIHLIKVDELLYIQACGDYVTLITPSGEFIKEQTMKFFEANLPSTTFVRIHRSTIVNVTQISRVELFGKDTYQLLLKNGTKLRVSLSGYRLLKERLGI